MKTEQELIDFNNMTQKIEAIHLLGGRISDYLKKQGVRSITLVGDSDLIKIVCIDLIYSDEILISQIFTDDLETADDLKFLNKTLKVKKSFGENMEVKDDFVLVCTLRADKNYNKVISKTQGQSLVFIKIALLSSSCGFLSRKCQYPKHHKQ